VLSHQFPFIHITKENTMKRLQWCAAVCLIALFASEARPESTIQWTSGYPATGSSTGTIDISGSITLDSGWYLVDTKVTVRVWIDDSTLTTTTFDVNQCTLTSGVTYNATVEIQITDTDGKTTYTLVTAPKTAMAK